MEFHELSTLFPSFEGTMEFEALALSIKTDGFDPKYPILTWKGKIIDGRHRYLAAQQANVEPTYRNLSDEASLDTALVEVTKANMLRRSLTVVEKAIVAEKMANLSSGVGKGQNTKTANLQTSSVSVDDAANKMNVSTRSVGSVRELRNNHPETYEQLEKGEFKSINAAVESTKPKKYRPMVMQKNTAEGSAITFIVNNHTIVNDFTFDEVSDLVMKHLTEKCNNPKLIPISREYAQTILNNRSGIEKLYKRLEIFLNTTKPVERLN